MVASISHIKIVQYCNDALKQVKNRFHHFKIWVTDLVKRISQFATNLFNQVFKTPPVNKPKVLVGRVTNVDTVSKSTERKVYDNPEIQIDANTSIIFNKKTGKYIYICEAPPIKNLVISGGGAKGVILPGVFQAFEEHKIGNYTFREQLDHVAGSSIGAVTAGPFAAGTSAEDFVKAAAAEDFKALLGKGYGPIYKDGVPLTNFIRTILKKTITKHLLTMFEVENIDSIKKVKKHLKYYFQKTNINYNRKKIDELAISLRVLLKTLKNTQIDKVQITFGMLKTLRELNSKIFKDLIVTATCVENGKTIYFDSNKTPNLDIAIACRASASLPIILSPVSIHRSALLPGYNDLDKDMLTFIDGGYLDNIPVDSVHNKQGDVNNKGLDGQNLQTLALVFDNSSRSDDEQSHFHNQSTGKNAIYKPGYTDWLTRDIFAKFFCGIATEERSSLNKAKWLEEIRQKYTQRNIPLLVPLKTVDFDKAKLLEKELIQKGYEQGLEYLKNHDNELMLREYVSLDTLINSLPAEKKQLLNDAIIAEFRAAIGISKHD